MIRKDDTDAAGFAKIARGLSDLFNFLAGPDDKNLPRRGRHEKDGMVIEYSFGRRTAAEAMSQREEAEPPPEPTARRARAATATPRRAAKRSELELLEPVTDVFDEPGEIVFLFELPGISRRDIRTVVDGDIFLLEARSGERLYRKEILIEAKLAAQMPHLLLRNGVLEVRLKKRK
jgi:HSP20 family protein